MKKTYTVLRYPGGKSQLLPFIESKICGARMFAEPYAGGAGVGLGLLLEHKIDKLFLNDISYPIFCLWDSIIHSAEQLISLVESTPVTVDSWNEEKKIYDESSDILRLGFATLFLNRTNFSGILGGKPIGGFDQSGKNKIDCRFNKKNIIEKIRAIADCSDRIEVSCRDGAEFIRSVPSDDVFLFVDPPYFVQGKSLYGTEFTEEKFIALSDSLSSVKNPFLLTMDDVPVLRKIFGGRFSIGTKELRYSANNKRKQGELIVFRANSADKV